MIKEMLFAYYRNAGHLLAIYLVVAVLGRVAWCAWNGRSAENAGVATSIGSAFAFLGAKTLFGRVFFTTLALYVYNTHRMMTLDLFNPLVWIGVFLIRDLVYYWVHRLEHSVRVLWASHLVHHSADRINPTTGIRLPWMEALYKPWFSLWMPVIGFNPVAAIALDVFAAALSPLQHTERFAARPGSLAQRLAVTASSHRVHHGYNPEYIDKNFGAVLIIWDRMFGTYEPEVAPVLYGVGSVDRVDGLNGALVGGYRRLATDIGRTSSPRLALRVALGRP